MEGENDFFCSLVTGKSEVLLERLQLPSNFQSNPLPEVATIKQMLSECFIKSSLRQGDQMSL
jgi:hypothetical protein